MRSRWLSSGLLGLTTFGSAFLLFQVQPLLSKAILPWFGGSPAVWTVAMLFFQVALFVGYVYSHCTTRYLPAELQAILHVALLATAVWHGAILPGSEWKPSPADDPTWHILRLLTSCVGLPYFLLAATGPLLQGWFARIHPMRSPYRLYALSNAGSLLALLSYPFVIEPALDVARQGQFWLWGFWGFGVCVALCSLFNALVATDYEPAGFSLDATIDLIARPTYSDWLLWIALSATASVLLLATTNQICQEVAVIPFLWVLPLSVYLLSFILTFDSSRWYSRRLFYIGLALSAGASLWLMMKGANATIVEQLAAFFALLFCGCMVCHGELVRIKPHPRYLTSFYLCLSAGGALGGILVGVIAPRVLTSYLELDVAIGAALLLPLIVFWRDPTSELAGGRRKWVWAGALCVCAAVLAGIGSHVKKLTGRQTDAARNFFGVLKVEVYGDLKLMKHGGVLHGQQFQVEEKRRVATTYYGDESAAGLLLKTCRPNRPLKVGMIGLGTGTTAAYGQAGDHFRFYDINPEVVRLAKKHFTFLSDSAAKVDVVMGDARLQMESEESQHYDVLLLDAFTGDGIPVHLLTSEAFDIYRRHLQPDGVIGVHISNRHLNLRPVVQAQAARLGLLMDTIHSAGSTAGQSANSWVLVTANTELLGRPEIEKLKESRQARIILWTDARSDLMTIMNRPW